MSGKIGSNNAGAELVGEGIGVREILRLAVLAQDDMARGDGWALLSVTFQY